MSVQEDTSSPSQFQSGVKRKRQEEYLSKKDGIAISETNFEQQQQGDEELQVLRNASKSSEPAIPSPGSGNRGSGIGKFNIGRDLPNENDGTFELLAELHDRVSERAPEGVTWGEADRDVDPRRRRYAFLPGQRRRLLDSGITVQAEGSMDNREHDFSMSPLASIDIVWKNTAAGNKSRSCETTQQSSEPTVDIKQCFEVEVLIHDALEKVTNHIQSMVSDKYKEFITMNDLIAVQPNHHNGATYLPAHLDFPRADGFGVVIATICIRNANNSKVILIDEGDDEEQPSMSWNIHLSDGDCYFLSGDSRNKCHHGVLSETNAYRETLNLRYGLHPVDMAREEVYRHWPD